MNYQQPTPLQGPVKRAAAQCHDPLESVRPELERVKAIFWEQFKSNQLPQAVFETVDYVLSQPGKMMRPGLVLLSGLACGSLTQDHYVAGAILELIHNATLLHDDVIDRSDLRRGRSTANAHWGDLSAVLLGDVLLAVAIDMCVDLPAEAMRQITAISKQVCMGELHQTLRFRHWELELQEYLDIITDKTACFFQGACSLGAQLSGADARRIQTFNEYGLCVGVAFQIRDDILDVCGEQDQTGKPVGTDIRQERPTLPLLHYLDRFPEKREEIFEKAGSSNKDDLVKTLEQAGSLSYARQLAQTYADQALACLKEFKTTDAYEPLSGITRFTVERLS